MLNIIIVNNTTIIFYEFLMREYRLVFKNKVLFKFIPRLTFPEILRYILFCCIFVASWIISSS